MQSDWNRILNNIKIAIPTWIFFFLLFLALSFGSVNKHNRIRKNIPENSPTINAVVTHIRSIKAGEEAEYSFNINGQPYKGETFNSFHGNKGDNICVKYNATNPDYNISCTETKPESRKDTFSLVLKMIGFLSFVCVIFILFGNKKKEDY